MGFEELAPELKGLSEAQLRLILEVVWEGLSKEKKELVVRLGDEMKRENEQDKKRG